MMRQVLLVGAVLALVSGAGSPRVYATSSAPASAAKSLLPVLGISYVRPTEKLAWFDPLTLRQLRGRKAPLLDYTGSWAFSGDRALLAVGSCTGKTPPGIRLVNARAMRVRGDVRLSRYRGCASALTWLRADRLVAVVSTSVSDGAEAVALDPVARRVLHRAVLEERCCTAIGRTHDELVVLLTAFGSFAPAQVAAIDAEGRVRTRAIDRILAGTVVDEESADHRSRTIQPGLAVDPESRRAFVVPADGPVAEVDLETLALTYHALDGPSLLQRFLSWLVPAAQAKVTEGPVREARWLGNGIIAVSGHDYSLVRAEDGRDLMTAEPVGLMLIDTRSWTVRSLEPDASGFAVGDGLVIAQGGDWDSEHDRLYGPGLRAFGLDGRERWRRYPGEYRWLAPAGPIGYVSLGDGRTDIVDIATGAVLAQLLRDEENDPPWPQLLAAQTADW